jgi:uncharacterized protein (TIGR02996 family)
VSEEEAFLKAIAECPGDDASRLVYADWLDDHDLPQQAAFLRAECATATGKPMHPRVCRRYAKALPAAWLRAVGRPSIAGTVWVSEDDSGPARIRFHADGTLSFQRFAHGVDPAAPSGSQPKAVPGKWQQVGSVVLFNVNDFSDHFGRLNGGQMPVRWTNKPKDRGAWVFRQVEEKAASGRRKRRKAGE